jgi:hypothetical protein
MFTLDVVVSVPVIRFTSNALCAGVIALSVAVLASFSQSVANSTSHSCDVLALALRFLLVAPS